MFITAFFVISPHWKQSKLPSMSEWLNKLWYSHTMEYFSALKSNIWHKKFGLITKVFMLSEKYQSQDYIFYLYGILEITKL